MANDRLINSTQGESIINGLTTIASKLDALKPISAADNGKVVKNAQLVAQTAYPSTVTENNTYDTTNYNSITVEVEPPVEFSATPNTFTLVTNISNLNVVIPNGPTSIGNSAFRDCKGLKSIKIPSSVTSINYNVFNGCTGLTSVEIPSSVTSIGSNAFANCTNLATITVHKAEGSISEAPWGATNATVVWDG